MPKEEASPDSSAESTQRRKKESDAVLCDSVALIVDSLLQADPQVKVRVHDENWADLALSRRTSAEEVIRSLRGLAEGLKAQVAGRRGRKPVEFKKEQYQDNFVAKFPKHVESAVSACVAEDGRLYVDAIPMTLKAYLAEFVREVCGVDTAKAMMTRGVCADLRASESYLANR